MAEELTLTLRNLKKVLVWSGCFMLSVAMLAPSPASADGMDWSKSFWLHGNRSNLLVSVSLNPQPDPPLPVRNALNLSNPRNPIIFSDTTGLPGDTTFRILFALAASQPLIIDAVGTPDGNGHLLIPVFHAVNGFMGTQAFSVIFDLGTSSGGLPVSGGWNWLNPQPEPPLPSTLAFGVDFQFDHLSVASLGLQILDNDSQELLTFAPVPEPSTLLLLGSSLVGLGAVTWRRARRK